MYVPETASVKCIASCNLFIKCVSKNMTFDLKGENCFCWGPPLEVGTCKEAATLWTLGMAVRERHIKLCIIKLTFQHFTQKAVAI